MQNTLHFSQCTLPLLDKIFGLRAVRMLPALEACFQRSSQIELTEFDTSGNATPRAILPAKRWQPCWSVNISTSVRFPFMVVMSLVAIGSMTLEETHYAISYGHNALQEAELADILRPLMALKQLVIQQSAG